MCGFVGFFVSKRYQDYKNELSRAVNYLSHRGPDNQSLWFHDDLGFGVGHNRLSILDLSDSGNQPMLSYSKQALIAYNGQIYNFIELAQKLDLDHENVSDTRIILEAISNWGLEKAVREFNGMFSFVLVDLQQRKIYLVRDSIGIKPLYWSKVPDGFIFGSELKALKSFSSFRTEISKSAAYNYFINQYIPSPLSIYESCYKLNPSTIMCLDESRDEAFIHYEPKSSLDYSTVSDIEEAESLLRDVLIESVRRHSRSDVPVSTFMSAGVDSTLISSLLSQSQTLNSFSIGYMDGNYDESKQAELIARHLGLTHNSIIIKPEDIVDIFNRIPDIYDEPFADASCIPTTFLSEHVSHSYKVAFSGDGADELFAGYPKYMSSLNAWRSISRIPYMIRRPIALTAKRVESILGANQFTHGRTKEKLGKLHNLINHKTLLDFYHHSHYLGLPSNMITINHSDMHNIRNLLLRSAKKGMTNLSDLLFYDQAFRLPDNMLTKVDRASMTNSLEIRVPFLDNEVVNFARTIPTKFLNYQDKPKYLLRSILSKYVPNALFDMPKKGFHIPMKLWLRQYFNDYAGDILFSQSAKSEQLISTKGIQSMWKSYMDGNDKDFYPLWTALMYLQWRDANS